MGNHKNHSGDNGKIIMPEQRRVVDLHNNPVAGANGPAPEAADVTAMQVKDKIVGALRQLASQIEDGTISEPEYVILLPKLKNGEVPLLFFGEPMPTLMIEAVLNRVVTKMAMQ